MNMLQKALSLRSTNTISWEEMIWYLKNYGDKNRGKAHLRMKVFSRRLVQTLESQLQGGKR